MQVLEAGNNEAVAEKIIPVHTQLLNYILLYHLSIIIQNLLFYWHFSRIPGQ